jgi:undecaprenyl diphosphate synthase
VLKLNEASEQLAKLILKRGNLPGHVAVIMDGNGRWAQKRGLPRTIGHRAGVKAVKRVVQAASRINIGYLTLYTFSSENWKRPKGEVSAIMKLLYDTTKQEMRELVKNNVRLITTGKIEELPHSRRQILEKAIQATSKNTGLTLNLALNYSGREEIIEAVRTLSRLVKENGLQPNQINEQLFSQHLYTKSLPDPDLLIRTSGEMRLSNFLLWQTSYTELYITEVLWPDFNEEDFFRAIQDYQSRERRFGQL